MRIDRRIHALKEVVLDACAVFGLRPPAYVKPMRCFPHLSHRTQSKVEVNRVTGTYTVKARLYKHAEENKGKRVRGCLRNALTARFWRPYARR